MNDRSRLAAVNRIWLIRRAEPWRFLAIKNTKTTEKWKSSEEKALNFVYFVIFVAKTLKICNG